MKLKTIFFAGMLAFCITVHAHAETIRLSVAASMTDAFREIIANFSVAHPALKLQPNFASSGSLAKQIEQDAPIDIYVSANPKWMTYLAEKQLIETGANRIFAHNRLVFIGMESRGDLSMNDLSSLERIAIGAPLSVPAGQYARQAMKKSGVYANLEQDRKLVLAKDVRQALLYADRGEVDGAFVYKTDALLAVHAKILFVVPAELHSRISYPLALTAAGAKKESARTFYDYMGSPEVVAILVKFGFEPAR